MMKDYISPYQVEYRRHMIVCSGIDGSADADMWAYLMGTSYLERV